MPAVPIRPHRFSGLINFSGMINNVGLRVHVYRWGHIPGRRSAVPARIRRLSVPPVSVSQGTAHQGGAQSYGHAFPPVTLLRSRPGMLRYDTGYDDHRQHGYPFVCLHFSDLPDRWIDGSISSDPYLHCFRSCTIRPAEPPMNGVGLTGPCQRVAFGFPGSFPKSKGWFRGIWGFLKSSRTGQGPEKT